jgi:ribonucleoside-diphosphate reductase alpha chain
MVQSQPAQHNALHDLGYKIFLDRYAQKDMTRSTLTVGDTVIVVVDSKTGQREIGKIKALKLPKVTVELLDGDVVERDVEHVDKPLEVEPGQMMDRVAAGIAGIEASPEQKQLWTERFRWLLDDWKFVPAGRILAAAGTDQQLTFYNCMPPEQEILTANGYKPIADVRVGDMVVTHRNRLRPVRHKMERETEETLYIIRPKKIAYDDLRVTGDHKVYAIRAEWVNKHKSRDGLRLAQQPDWIPAKELNPGDYVSVAFNGEECPPETIELQDYLPGYEQQDGKLFKATTRGDHGYVEDWGTHVSINAHVQIDAELCYVFGRWLGDGCITHRTGTDIPSGIKIVFGLDEKAEAEELARLIEAKFGIAAALKLSSTERWYDLWVNSMLIGQFFKAFLGAYSYSKRIPDALLHLPNELTLELLRGLFSADGYISDNKLGIVLSNRELCVQVHQLLLRLGYLFSIRENTHRLGRVPAYRVQATSNECAPLFEHFFGAVAPMSETDTKHYFEYDGLKWLRIDEIAVEDYSGIVMDIEVEEDHSFVSAGVVVSNCYVIPSPKDSRGGIIETLRQMTEIMSRGGGVGINVSSLRPRHAYVKGVNGRSSGAVSWGALYSFVTGLIEQGGCFGPNERIATDRGLIPAAELADRIEAGEAIYAQTHKGLRRITARFRNGVKPLFELRTKRGFKVHITEDHKVAVLMDGEIVTMPLKYLAAGDEVLLLLGSGVPGNDAQLPDDLNEELAYLAGYTAAGGSSAPSQAEMVRRLKQKGLVDTQRVPEAIFRAPSSVQMAFIAGYTAKTADIESRYEQMIADIQQLLGANGILSWAECGKHDAGAIYRLHVSETDMSQRLTTHKLVSAQAETVGRLQLAVAAATDVAISEHPSVVPDTIESITQLAESQVYDFEVDDVHLLSGSGIYTSNSRRGALMLILNDWHPDVFDFINSKRKAGQITNANISVGVSDKLMDAVKANGDWDLVFPDTSEPGYDTIWDGDLDKWVADGRRVLKYRTVKARAVWDAIIESAWASAEPGVFFRERYNKMSNSWYFAPIISTNPCVTGDTLVSTEHGYTKARDLQVGMKIRTPAGLKPIEKIYNNGIQRIYRVEFSDGGYLECTADHKLKVVRGKKYEWVAVSDLQKGDKVLVMPNEAFGEKRDLPDEALRYIEKRKLNMATQYDRTLGLFAGVVIGDGSLRQLTNRDSYSNYCKVAFGAKEDSWLEHFQGLMRDAGIRTNLRRFQKEIALPNGTVALHQALTMDCYKLATLLIKSGLKPNLKAPQKALPESFLSLDREFLAGVLDGLFSTDGNVSMKRDNPMLRFTTASYQLAQQVRQILFQFGIHGRIYTSERDPDLMYDGRSMTGTGIKYEVVIMNEGIPRFYSEIGLSHPQKADRLKEIAENWHYMGGTWTASVVSVQDTEREEEVYDVYEPNTLTWITNSYVSLDCGEQGLPAFGVCNLGAINLAKFYDAEKHDVAWDELDQAARYATRFLDNVIDSTPYFFDENYAQQSSERRVGLNNMGLAELMIRLGIRYGSDESVTFIDKLYGFLARAIYETSIAIAREKGPFPKFDAEKFLQSGYMLSMPDDIREQVRQHGIRNVTLTTQAPTGTTGTMVNTSTGIEPFFSWVYYRKSRLGLHEEQVPLVKEWYDAHPGEKKLPDYFVTAMDLSPEEHVKVQGAIQRWVDSSISKTCNVPNNYTVEQVSDLYMYMYELGCKGGTIYRDGSRDEQVLMLKGDDRAETEMANKDKARAAEKPAEKAVEKLEQVATPHRVYPRPKRLSGVTISRKTPFGTAYITMNSDEHNNPFEVFITVGKAGSDLQADAEGLGRMISLGLRTTAPQNRKEMLKLIVDQLQGIGGSRAVGMGPSRVTSLPDAVAGALMEFYFPPTAAQQLNLPIGNGNGTPAPEAPTEEADVHSNGHVTGFVSGADICPECKMVTLIKAEGCEKCLTCGYSRC